MPYRMIYLGLGALAVAAIALGVAFAPEGETIELPAPIEAVAPLPGESVIRQATIEVDLEVGYTADIWVDGYPVPDNEVDFIDATGVHRWGPSPTSLVISGWEPGEHTIRVDWTRIVDLPETGSFEWSFRVQ